MIRFDTGTRAALEKLISSSFPDAHIDEGSITGLAAALWVSKSQHLDLSKYSDDLENLAKTFGLQVVQGTGEASIHCKPGQESSGVRYYEAQAEHARKAPPMDAFVGKLSMARVTLPASEPETIQTRLGSVEPRDHLLATLAEVQKEYGSEVSYPIARVDLVSPARLGGTRFGAIGVYLGYADAAGMPTFYILEAGTATGDSKVLYFKEFGDGIITSFTGYRPTPFSNPKHAYNGKLTLNGDSPDRLQVTARRASDAEHYIRIDVHFTETNNPDVVWPAFHIMRALGIVIDRLHHVPIG